MTKDEALRLALEALESGEKMQNGRLVWIEHDISLVKQAIPAIKAALEAKDEPWECVCGANLYIDANGIPRSKASVEPATVMFKPEQEAKDEPVAWLHTKIEGVAVPHRPADLDKHPDRWEALYKTPPSCPTCKALSRTVMLDQTSHDTTPPQRTWVGLTDEDIEQEFGFIDELLRDCVQRTEAKLKEKNT